MSAKIVHVSNRSLTIDGVTVPGVLTVEMAAMTAKSDGPELIIRIRADRVEWVREELSTPDASSGSTPAKLAGGEYVVTDRRIVELLREAVKRNPEHP